MLRDLDFQIYIANGPTELTGCDLQCNYKGRGWLFRVVVQYVLLDYNIIVQYNYTSNNYFIRCIVVGVFRVIVCTINHLPERASSGGYPVTGK